MMRASAWIAGVAMLALAGCGDQPAPVLGGAPARSRFLCPPPGTTVTYSGGSTVRSTGTDASDREICLVEVRGRNGTRQQQRLFNYWSMPNTHAAVIRDHFGQLFPLQVGKTATFSVPSWDLRNMATVMMQENWRVVRRETVAVGTQQRNAFVLERARGFETPDRARFRDEVTIWIDEELGVLLRQQFAQVNGRSRNGTSYRATAIRTE